MSNKVQNENDPNLSKAIQQAEEKKYSEALHTLERAGGGDRQALLNARAVCLMRMGEGQKALAIYRQFIFSTGGVFMNRELPVHYRANFATALLMSDLPGGARDALGEMYEERNHPSVARLKQAMSQWEKRLSLWQYVNWKLGVAPPLPCTLDFLPGDFVDPAAPTLGKHPPKPSQQAA